MNELERKEFNKRFFEDTDDTGRFIVRSFRTGIAYYVEPLDKGERRRFGDVNPATGQMEGAYGLKHKGAIHPSQSLITEENGFQNITTLPAGTSPYAHINTVDDEHYERLVKEGKIKV